MCLNTYTCHCMCVGIRGQLSPLGFLPPPRGSQFKFRLPDLAAVPFSAEPLCQPLLFGFEAGAHVTQASLGLDKSLRMTLNFCCLHLLSIGITGRHCPTQFYTELGMKLRISSCMLDKYESTQPHPWATKQLSFSFFHFSCVCVCTVLCMHTHV